MTLSKSGTSDIGKQHFSSLRICSDYIYARRVQLEKDATQYQEKTYHDGHGNDVMEPITTGGRTAA